MHPAASPAPAASSIRGPSPSLWGVVYSVSCTAPKGTQLGCSPNEPPTGDQRCRAELGQEGEEESLHCAPSKLLLGNGWEKAVGQHPPCLSFPTQTFAPGLSQARTEGDVPPPPRRAVNCDPAGLWGRTALPPTVLGNGSTAPLHTPLCTLGSPLHGCVHTLCPCLHHTVSLSHCMCVFVAPGGTQCMSRSPLHIWFPLCMCVSPCARGMPVSPP